MMMEQLKMALNGLDTRNGNLHKAQIEMYADGSGYIEVWNDDGITMEWHESFECTRGLFAAVKNYAGTPPHVREANAIAELLKCEPDTTDLKAELWLHFEKLMDDAELADPETIRRVYPLLVEIADSRRMPPAA